MSKSSWARSIATAALFAVLGVHVASGVRGVGFGRMWDEEFQLAGVQHAIDPVAFPAYGHYYGGLYYVPGYMLVAPTFLRALPAVLRELRAKPTRPFDPTASPALVETRKKALDVVSDPSFVNKDRRIFVWIAALAIVWVFLAAAAATRSRWAALAAAAAVGTSWELSYHGRWIAVDAMLAQFSALTLALVCAAVRAGSPPRQRLLLRCAAVVAGLGLGSKMPGVFLIVPIAIAWALSPHAPGGRAKLARVAEAGLLMLAVFVATTPGIVLDPLHYANDVYRVVGEYNGIADDYSYCVPRLGHRLLTIGAYWTTALFSPYLPVALGFAALALAGAVVGVRERRPDVVAILAFLILYTGFVAMQRLLVVRNLLVTFPALAILAAVGLARAGAFLGRWRHAPLVLVAACVLVAALDARWIWRAASTIGKTTDDTILAAVAVHLRDHARRPVYVSPGLEKALAAHAPEVLARANVQSWDKSRDVLIYATSIPAWRANRPRFATTFGSLHANYDYYPELLTWSTLEKAGDPVVLVDRDRLAAFGVTTAPTR